MFGIKIQSAIMVKTTLSSYIQYDVSIRNAQNMKTMYDTKSEIYFRENKIDLLTGNS